jgi:hypothetical protein
VLSSLWGVKSEIIKVTRIWGAERIWGAHGVLKARGHDQKLNWCRQEEHDAIYITNVHFTSCSLLLVPSNPGKIALTYPFTSPAGLCFPLFGV